MTREEAKRTMEYLSVCSENHVTMAINSRDRQAIDMAIKALEEPEQKTCKTCCWWEGGHLSFDCPWELDYEHSEDDYCSLWKRRTE